MAWNSVTEKTAPTALSEEQIVLGFSDVVKAASMFEGATAPNPPVGCALYDAQGRRLALAAHMRAGDAHAEAAALEQCRSQGTLHLVHTALVSLEPCTHVGRTPPCSEALLKTPLKQIWIGVRDQNPVVAGGGAEQLAQAGVDVHFLRDLAHPDAPKLERQLHRLVAPFHKLSAEKRPWVTVKQAVTATGSMIPPRGQKTFTSAASLTFAHQLRRRSDAILTGSGTVLADDPHFTVRHVHDFAHKHRTLVLLDRRARIPSAYQEEARQRGFNVVRHSSLEEALEELGQRGVMEVLVEAGPVLTDAVLTSGLWDEHFLIRAAAANQEQDAITHTYRSPHFDPDFLEVEHVFRNY